MSRKNLYQYLGVVLIALNFSGCIPNLIQKTANKSTPANYYSSQDTANTANIKWKDFFTDSYLKALIDTALRNNQELNIVLQEIQIANNEVRAKKGAYLPFVDAFARIGVEKVGRYTTQGASEVANDIKPDVRTPEAVPNFALGVMASWEVDIWRKLRNAKKSAIYRYLSTVEGRNFMITQLVAEIANSYYELMALDNQLDILKKNIEIQSNALAIVRLQKQAAKVTELAVRRFEAQVFNTRSRQYVIQQMIIETENRINFLVGRYPQPILRNSEAFNNLIPSTIYTGIPSQLLTNRPDIKQAELNLMASKLDIQVARANFYPTFLITAGVGFEAFNPKYLIKAPESLLYSLAGGLVGPLINRNAIQADYYSANARQIRAAYSYERSILNAYLEVTNQISNISNLENSYNQKAQEVQTLTQSITIANNLFRSALADYMEVLLTQRDALESTMHLVEIKKQQMNATVNVYKALGGGWN